MDWLLVIDLSEQAELLLDFVQRLERVLQERVGPKLNYACAVLLVLLKALCYEILAILAQLHALREPNVVTHYPIQLVPVHYFERVLAAD